MRHQQKKSHPHRTLPPALRRQQLRAVLRRGLEAETRAMREYMRKCETEQREYETEQKKTGLLALTFWTAYCALFLSLPFVILHFAYN